MNVIAYKLRHDSRSSFVSGFAARVELDEGRIRLCDRRLPLGLYTDGILLERAVRLGDLELPTEGEGAWAVWGVIERAEWWDRLATPVSEEDRR